MGAGLDDRNTYLADERCGVILNFLRGQRPDWNGRWLTDIRAWGDDQLEEDHHYIQWLFPLTTESEAVFAPVLRDYEVAEFRRDDKLREVLVASLRQMLHFYGFELNVDEFQSTVIPSERHEKRRQVWMTPGNHNYRRISRILGSLVLLGIQDHAKAFLEALEHLYRTPEGVGAIDGLAMGYWQQRASVG
jgi:hypothetical protein